MFNSTRNSALLDRASAIQSSVEGLSALTTQPLGSLLKLGV
ncbi:hypothetical protein ACKFKF_28050 [Phormidesmis sp. 146-12]